MQNIEFSIQQVGLREKKDFRVFKKNGGSGGFGQEIAELNAKRPNSALAVACDLSTEQANAEYDGLKQMFKMLSEINLKKIK